MADAPATEYESALDDYLDSADYAETGSASKARTLVTACRKLMVLVPAVAKRGAAEVRHEMSVYREAIAQAQAWLAVNDTTNGGGVKQYDLSGFRN